MMARYAIPVVDRRGAGLGNELILWAKAFIAGQALGMQALHPAWGINRRRYWRYFKTSRVDYATHRLLRATLPSVRFEEADYIRHGGGDYADAVRSFAAERDIARRAPFVLEIAGLWAGPGMLGAAREFIGSQLLITRWTLDNLYKIDRRVGDERLRVGVHIRRGDFNSLVSNEDYAGKFNVTVPIEWYKTAMATLYRTFGDRVVFVIASDASPTDLLPLTETFPCVTTHDLPNGDISDMLALAQSDFLLCSISSFSLWAAFLGEMPYGWFAPQLTEFKGTRSIWGHLQPQQLSQSPLGQARSAMQEEPTAALNSPRGVAVSRDGVIPDDVLAYLDKVAIKKRRSTDLVRYGVIAPTAVKSNFMQNVV